jgi:hypothetical protein
VSEVATRRDTAASRYTGNQPLQQVALVVLLDRLLGVGVVISGDLTI